MLALPEGADAVPAAGGVPELPKEVGFGKEFIYCHFVETIVFTTGQRSMSTMK